MTNLESRWTLLPKTAAADTVDLAALKDAIKAFTTAMRNAQRGKPMCLAMSEGFEWLESFLESGGPKLVGAAQFAAAAARRIDRVCP